MTEPAPRPSRADTTEGRTEALPSGRDPREVVGIYLSDSIRNIEAIWRVLASAGISPQESALGAELSEAHALLEEAQKSVKELETHA